MNIKRDITGFRESVTHLLGVKQVFTDYIDRFAKGSDAGFYRMIPLLVVQVNSENELRSVLKAAHQFKISITFKAGGTSLSGQTITDSVLIETGPYFNRYEIRDEGKRIKLQPGVRGGFANMQLSEYGYKIGPAPASVNAAKVGGIVANNASGASYGIATNSYNTVEAMRIVMHDGSLLVTDDKDSRSSFEKSHSQLLRDIVEIKQEISSSEVVSEKIKAKYRLKNTTGYGMNSFVDFDDPIDILMHLMIGSEGTLGFISEVTMRTIEDHPSKTCALIFFPDIVEAAKCIISLRSCRVSAAELMDRNALRAVEDIEGLPSRLKELQKGTAALLVEMTAHTREGLMAQKEEIVNKLFYIETLYPIEFTDDSKDYNILWKVRKGLFASAAATRPSGTTCIIEDVAFPGEVLDEALPALRSLLDKRHYQSSVIWGHLLDGNIHFLIMPDFKQVWQMDNYKAFMHDLADLVVNRFNGSLKAEHGTGRNMAPFVEYEWGSDIYQLMKRIKRSFDPENILNPGVLINSDYEVYIKSIKPLPQVHPIVDKCIECGFCESSCPSRDLTLTPRQRIVVYRALNSSQRGISKKSYRLLRKAFNYKGEESCATDGLCALSCPVDINTGKLITELRYDKAGGLSNSIASRIANHYGGFNAIVRGALSLAATMQKVLSQPLMRGGSRLLHKVSGRSIPLWNRYVPSGAARVDTTSVISSGDKVVYFPACINRVMGNGTNVKEKEALTSVIKRLVNKAGYEVLYPKGLKSLCCGMAFDSKGFKRQGMMKLQELELALLEISDNGSYPVLCDMSPCTLRMKELMDKRLKFYEPIEFTWSYLRGRLQFTKQSETVMVHATCSTTKMGLDEKLIDVAKLCAGEVVSPKMTGCCGWAGDKGFSLPELNKSALRYLKEEVPEQAVAGYSTSRTCEIGLSLHSGLIYQSIFYLVDRATETKFK